MVSTRTFRRERESRSRSGFRRLVIALLVVSALTNCTAPGARVEDRDAALPAAKTPILLFTGTGTSPNDVKAIETLLVSNHLDFSTISSFELNGMKEKDLRG